MSCRRISMAAALMGCVFFAYPCLAEITDCDRLAASPADMTRPSNLPGVAFDAIKAGQAVPACRKALADSPGRRM